MLRKIKHDGIEDLYFDELSFTTSDGTFCYHYIHCDKTVELLSRLKHSKYFRGKRKFKFEDDCNDIDEAIKNYEINFTA